MRIEDGHGGEGDALTYIWWIVKNEYGTENDINVLGYLSEKSPNDDWWWWRLWGYGVEDGKMITGSGGGEGGRKSDDG